MLNKYHYYSKAAILSNRARKLLWFKITKMLTAFFNIIFGTLSLNRYVCVVSMFSIYRTV